MQTTIGVDIGGTKVAAGLVDSSGAISRKVRVPMAAAGDGDAGFAAVKSAIDGVLEGAPEARAALRGIGLCSPGPLDPKTGVVINPPNLPCWRGFPLAAETEKAFGVPARVDNDANAAALAEVLWGAAAGYRNVFYATIGTGFGTGIVLDNKIYHGRTGSAAEGGHNTIDYHGPRCGCGKRGCVEALCAGPAIALRAQARLGGQAPSRMLELVGGALEQVRAEHVGQAYLEGDALAGAVLEETADLLAVWLGNVIDMLEPEVIVVGGGVAGLMSHFFPRILKQLPQWSVNQRAAEIPLLMARYGADAGIAGAAAICR